MLINLGLVLSDPSKLQSTIKANPQLWTHVSECWRNFEQAPLFFLGSPTHSSPELYFTAQSKSLEFLQNNDLLTTTLLKIEQYFNLPTEHIVGTSLPGFHIFKKPLDQDVNWSNAPYHSDSDYKRIFPEWKYNFNNFYSFLVPIELGEAGSALDVEGAKLFAYELGHAYLWKSNISHRRSPVILTQPDEYRITFQGHIIVELDKILYFW